MLGRLYKGQDCSTARSLELVGERWSLLILRDAMFRNFTRFSQFQRSLGLATNILTKRLEDFVVAGLMQRRQPGTSGEQAEYLLTPKGLDFKPVIMALAEWADKWVRPGPAVFHAGSDGQPVELQLRRVGDDTRVSVSDVVAKPRGNRPSNRHRRRSRSSMRTAG
jgi:DNA-binding HxlR family transcriptional regulator